MAKINLEVSKNEGILLTAAISALLAGMENEMESWRNNSDDAMEHLFGMMELQVRAGDLWVRLQEALGIDRAEIVEALRNSN